MMKKLMAVVLALALALGAGLACGEASRNLAVPRMGTLTDQASGRITADLYPAALTGTGYTNELSLDIHWQETAESGVNYYLILEPVSDDGNVAEYNMKGDIVHLTLNEKGEIGEETWENREIQGTATFAVNGEGITELSFHDEVNPDLNDVKLRFADVPAPTAEELTAKVLRPVFELEEESAGAEMKRMAVAADLIAYAGTNGFYGVNQEELAGKMKEAADSLQLTEEEYAALKTKAAAVAEAVRLASGLTVEDTAEQEEVNAMLKDAGALETVRGALTGFTATASAEALAARLEGLR